jgi:hypothetical protein
LLFALPSGCFGSGVPTCSVVATPATFAATWYDAPGASALDDALQRAGWSPTGANASFARLANGSALAAVVHEGAIAGQGFTALVVTDLSANVTSQADARAALEPLLRDTMDAASGAMGGAPKLATYEGGRPTCSA